MKRRKLTNQEIEWSKNLKRQYLLKKAELGIRNQTELGERLGITQSATTQYLNGVIPLNTDRKLQFAAALRIGVDLIDPEFELSGNLSEDELRLLENYRKSSDIEKQTLLSVSEMASQK